MDVLVQLINPRSTAELYTAILTEGSAILGVVDGFISLVNPRDNVLQWKAGSGLFKTCRSYNIERGLGVAGMAWETGGSVIVNNYRQWAKRGTDPLSEKTHSLIAVPLLEDKSILGVITFINTQEDFYFTQQHVQELEQFCILAASAILNIRERENLENKLIAKKIAQEVLKESELKFRLITENIPDLILQVDQHGKISYASPSSKGILGYTPRRLLGTFIFDYVYKEDVPLAFKILQTFQQKGSVENCELRVQNACGGTIWMEFKAKPLFDKKRSFLRAVIASHDITARKQAEKELNLVSHYDSLTGLYNRTFFEKEVEAYVYAEVTRGIIICDIDGLKLVNDSLGHQAGDGLLMAVANIISKAAVGHVAARIGGDEFAVFINNCAVDEINRICRKIRKGVSAYNKQEGVIPLSLSIGFSYSDSPVTKIYEIIKEADDNMYHNKLVNTRSARLNIAHTMLKIVEQRDVRGNINYGSVEHLATHIAGLLGMANDSMEFLKLLAKFHDIGKIGIGEQILGKQGILTSHEQSEIKKHPEIGYRIARSVPDLLSISDFILKHHERWDGSGYPLGLKENQIPVECRIMAIIEAYFAMVTDRPYRKALPQDKALEELSKGAGKQFDPGLVKMFSELVSTRT